MTFYSSTEQPVMSLWTIMVRAFKPSDINDVLNIWLEASIRAHGFVDRKFWESRIDDMRDIYLPASDTYVFSEDGAVKGFFSLYGDSLAAMFVSPRDQGNGIGRQLMDKAKSLKKCLNLTVYRDNEKGFGFYLKSGFIPIKERADEHTGHIEILMEYSS